jgi:hypothetical protein
LQVYISFDKLWAKDSCSHIGGTFTNTIVAITKTGDMSSLYGYVNRHTAQMSASFNFTDLYQTPTPDEVYESQPRCWRSSMAAKGGRYRPMPANYTGCARTEPYEPIIKIPMEVRDLDSAWADCNGGIEGVYDPPSEYILFGRSGSTSADATPTVALTPTDAIVVPTRSESRISTSSAAPASSPFSNPAPKTTHAQSPDPKPTASAEPALQDGPAGSPVGTDDKDPQETPKTTRTGGGNVWPLPPSTDALSVLKSAQASAEAAQIAASFIAEAAKHQSKGPGQSGDAVANPDQDPDGSMQPAQIVASLVVDAAKHQSEESGQSGDVGAGKHRTEDTNVLINHATNDPARPTQTSLVWTQESEVFTAILAGGSAEIQGAGAVTTIANGDDAVFRGQKIRISPGGDRIEVNGAAVDVDPVDNVANTGAASKQATMAFEAAGQTFTAVPFDKSLVIEVAGSSTTVAYGAQVTFADVTLSLPSSFSGSNVFNANGQRVTMHALNRDSDPAVPSSTVWTQGGETFTARMRSDSTIVLGAAGTTTEMTAGSTVTLGDIVYSVPSPGGVLVHDGTSITLNRAAATGPAGAASASDHSGTGVTILDAGSSVVVEIGGRTFTLADGAQTTFSGRTISAESTGGALVIDGTATVGAGTRLNAAHSSENSNSDGTEESTAAATTATDAESIGSVSYLPMEAAMVFALSGFLFVIL